MSHILRSCCIGCAVGVLPWLGGCGPSVPTLLERGQYGEALCAVQAFDMPEHREELTQSLREALDPALHVHPVSRDELAGLVGNKAERLLKRAVVLRARHDSRAVDLPEFELAIALSSPGEEIEPLPLSLRTLAELTREELPEAHTERYGPSGARKTLDAAQNLGHVGASLLEMLTLGLVPLSKLVPAAPYRRSGSYTVEPTYEELAQAAPDAAQMQDALGTPQYQPFAGRTYDAFSIWPRPPRGAPVMLTIVVRYSANSPEGDCEIIDGIELPLAAKQSVEAGLRAIFGKRMRRLSELRRR